MGGKESVSVEAYASGPQRRKSVKRINFFIRMLFFLKVRPMM
jgi:hypothetical protein